MAALVAAHGGTVWVESPPGGGAIFRIAIPLAPEARYSAPGFDDGTDPDLLNSRRPLGPGPEVRPEESRVGRHSAAPSGHPEPPRPPGYPEHPGLGSPPSGPWPT